MRSPNYESASVVDIDYANNPDLAEIFSGKDSGDRCRLTLELQVISKKPDGITLGIEKVIAPEYGEEYEAEPDTKEPIMVRIRNATRNESRVFHKGPKGEVPETVQNSLGTTSNV